MAETSFAAPSELLIEDIATAALRAAGVHAEPSRWVRIDHGSANLVIVVDDTVVRIGRTAEAGEASLRAQRLVDALPALPFAVPRSVASPVRLGGIVAVAQQRLDGEPHPSGSGDPTQLRRLLDALAGVPTGDVRAHLAPARAFMGGDRWLEVMTEQAIPLLVPEVRSIALHAASAVAALESRPRTLVHGDLAGSNVLWRDGRVSGVIDWDLASVDTPAVDLAALGAWHGWAAIEPTTPASAVADARALARTHPLQAVCFAILQGRPHHEVLAAVARAERRLVAW